MIKKEDLAQAVSGCELDPVVPRSGKDNLFNENLYPQIFCNADPDFYLLRYWLAIAVTRCARGFPNRGYAKWMVLGFMWSKLSPILRSARNTRSYRIMSECQSNELLDPLNESINSVFDAAQKYYDFNKGSGATVIDVSQFYRNKRGRDKEFKQYWKTSQNKFVRKLDSSLKGVQNAIELFEG